MTEIAKIVHEGEFVETFGPFIHVRDERWQGEVKIYRNIETGEGIAVSRASTFDRGDETMIFPYDLGLNKVSDWGELYAGYGVDHETALHEYVESL